MFDRFIERPVLSTVISIIVVILGILGLVSLPVSQYPEIAPPTIVVSTSYQGANADVVLNSVVIPLEEQINGVEGMTYMTSSAGNDGSARITVTFRLGVNPDLASVNVQNRVALATPLLPQEVVRAGVTTRKSQASNLLIFALYSDNPAYDQAFVQNYADINLVPLIKRVPGVGDAIAFGLMTYSMRIWLKPDVMAAYGLVPNDISAALAEQNIEAAPGQFGERGAQSFQYTIKYRGRLKDSAAFGEIVVRTKANGQVLKLKDIARINLGALSYAASSSVNGKPAVGVAVSQTAGSNAQQVIRGSLQALDNIAKSLPEGIHASTMMNVNDFLSASIDKVVHTLIEAFLLVFMVVFLFLQDFRSTLIPAIAVPVAIIGTFFFLLLFGFTINLLTLFALLLAIGIVVDDAIVVVEAVHARLDLGEPSPLEASKAAMRDISGAIISITLVMASVFIPVTFIPGSSGVFYKQFGITLAIAIVLSAVNALTLSPALAALFLSSKEDEDKRKGLLHRFHVAFNRGFEVTRKNYEKAVGFLSHRSWIAFTIIILFSAGLYYLMKSTPTAFVPEEDMGAVMADIALPPAASAERTQEIITQVQHAAAAIPEISAILAVNGQGLISGAGSNYGLVVMKLTPWDKRTGKGQDLSSIIGRLFAGTAGIRDARIVFFPPPTLQGFGISGGFSFQLQDKTGGSIASFYKVCTDYLTALNQRPEIQYASTAFSPNFPQYEMDVNVPKVREAGLTVNNILDAMQGYYGGVYASNFNLFGKQYRVIYQADTAYRANPAGLNNIYVRNAAGVMAPITGFITMKRVYGPQSITRFNLFTAIAVTGAPRPGYSSGDAIRAVEEVAAQTLPAGYGYEFSGMTREEISAGGETIFVFVLILLFVYFLLSAQYESYILPFSILFSLPVGLAGAFVFARLFHISNNIYLQITLIMLVGLLSKNAILIVEFALSRRRQGMPVIQAAIQGAEARLRPILMTSFAFIFGLLPLMMATGAGATGNRSIGTGAVGGMLIGTFIGIFVIPTLFIVFESLQERISGPPKPAGARKKEAGRQTVTTNGSTP